METFKTLKIKKHNKFVIVNWISGQFKGTWYLWGKNSKNMQLLDILAYNSANKPSFQNPTKNPQCSMYWILKRWFISWITGQDVQKLLIFAIKKKPVYM